MILVLGRSKKEELVMNEMLNEQMINESVDEVKNEVIEEQESVVNEPVKPKTVIGSVVDCELLNVRREPNMTANILTRIEEGETVRILDEMKGFYKVQTNNGVIGFCMWNYINLNE